MNKMCNISFWRKMRKKESKLEKKKVSRKQRFKMCKESWWKRKLEEEQWQCKGWANGRKAMRKELIIFVDTKAV